MDPNGGRFWIQRITVDGKRREIGLGGFLVVTLAEAREPALANKRLAYSGGNPLAERRKAREVLTFSDAVERYLAAKLHEFRNEKHRKQWRATLDTYARPVLGDTPVQAITVADVLRALDKAAKGDSHLALALADVPRWWAELRKRDGIAARALEFLNLTAARSGEVRGMTWDEVDFGGRDKTDETDTTPVVTLATSATWTIPASRMKAGREHRVPLTPEAFAILKALPRLDGSPYVFFAPRGGQLSDMTVSAVMRRMQVAETKEGRPGFLDPRNKRPAVPHGLRSTFRQWAAERGFERDMAELALAHDLGTEVERAYQRSDMLDRRRAMMAA